MTQTVAVGKTNTLALVGFIVAFVIPIAGLVIGIAARRQLDAPGNVETGRGFARWATVIGALGLALQVAFFIVWLSLFTAAMSNAPGFG